VGYGMWKVRSLTWRLWGCVGFFCGLGKIEDHVHRFSRDMHDGSRLELI
jgi:hypothetical protein